MNRFSGATANDEMCNLYLMYYSSVEEDGHDVCGTEERKDITDQLPLDSDKLLPERNERFLGSYSSGHGKRERNMKAVRSDQILN